MGNKVNIICMKWGEKYDSSYVNILYNMVKRNLNRPFRFVCFTDNKSGLSSSIESFELPSLNLPEGIPERGWMKLSTFASNLHDLSGSTLFLDLDLVIVDNIDAFFDHAWKRKMWFRLVICCVSSTWPYRNTSQKSIKKR